MYWVISSMNAALCKYSWPSASDRFVSRDNQKRAAWDITNSDLDYAPLFAQLNILDICNGISNGNEFI